MSGIGEKVAEETGEQMIADARNRAKAAGEATARDMFERAGNPTEISRTELELAAQLATVYEHAFLVGFLHGTSVGSRDAMRIVSEVVDRQVARRAARH